MQHTHISLRYPIPGLSIDSALHYPTLPRGPPLATLAPKNIQLSDICKALVNQKPAKPVSQLEILEITCFLMPRSKSNLKLQNHLKIQNLTSKSKSLPKSTNINKNKVLFVCCFVAVFFLLFCLLCFPHLLRDISSETFIAGLCWGQYVVALLLLLCCFCFNIFSQTTI